MAEQSRDPGQAGWSPSSEDAGYWGPQLSGFIQQLADAYQAGTITHADLIEGISGAEAVRNPNKPNMGWEGSVPTLLQGWLRSRTESLKSDREAELLRDTRLGELDQMRNAYLAQYDKDIARWTSIMNGGIANDAELAGAYAGSVNAVGQGLEQLKRQASARLSGSGTSRSGRLLDTVSRGQQQAASDVGGINAGWSEIASGMLNDRNTGLNWKKTELPGVINTMKDEVRRGGFSDLQGLRQYADATIDPYATFRGTGLDEESLRRSWNQMDYGNLMQLLGLAVGVYQGESDKATSLLSSFMPGGK